MPFILLLLTACFAQAALTRPALWKLDSIGKTYAGTWCFHPGPNPKFASICANATLSALLETHSHNNRGPGLSIAYYDLKDGSVLGGADWANWDAVALPIGICTSGRVAELDDAFSTTCRFAVIDNDHDIPSAHAEECTINRSQSRVTDGCYSPPSRRAWFRLDDSSSSILTIIGLILALPLFGAYRFYCACCAQPNSRNENGQDLPLAGLGSAVGDVSAGPDVSHQQLARADVSTLVRGSMIIMFIY